MKQPGFADMDERTREELISSLHMKKRFGG